MSDRRAMTWYWCCLLAVALLVGAVELATGTATVATWAWSDAVLPVLRFWASLLP